MKQLISRWGKTLDKNNVLQEYPRPKLVRDSYVNLNGEWEYCINRFAETSEYPGTILVPFSPETFLSGVGRVLQPEEFLHYRRVFSLPEGFVKDKVFLHFGAVDQECGVFVNGRPVGVHKGGYLPFAFDITEHLAEGENVITLWVVDKTEKSPHARGKQKLVKKGKYGSLFYTPNSGIWKTVWLESVESSYVKAVHITPCFDAAQVSVTIDTEGREDTAEVEITKDGRTIVRKSVSVCQEVFFSMEGFEAWSPDTPHLYDVKITYGQDKVTSYFGMRKYSVKRDARGILRFYLNNKPFFFNGPLDQGYWPESLLTAPSDEALVYDIMKMKELGYNTIRKHIKIEPERFYYHCDRLGMAVWQDMPNGGGDYNMIFVTYLPNYVPFLGRWVKDNLYSLFKRKDVEGRRQYYADLKGMVALLAHYPSVAVWVPFNEGWGQFDAPKATAFIRSMDDTRLINEACGWFDQHGGDMYSIHNYVRKLKVHPQTDRVVALTEYGGYSYPVEGHLACEKEFGYQAYNSEEELTANYKRLWEEEIYPNVEKGLSSAIYTQISDIEEEINGLMTYDRDVDKMTASVLREMNEKLYRMFQDIT